MDMKHYPTVPFTIVKNLFGRVFIEIVDHLKMILKQNKLNITEAYDSLMKTFC
jgi:hypothetical protein